MYNDTLKVANKIISDDDLVDIFTKMNDDIKKYEAISRQETQANLMYEREYQTWTAKDFKGTFKVNVNFTDDTQITFDNYLTFISIFNSRITEIKNLWLTYSYSYDVKYLGQSLNYIYQSISMNISDYRMDIDVRLSSEDKKMDDVYNFIKNKILNAPEKYDYIVKQKDSIINKVGFALGMIPSLIICLLLFFVPGIREFYFVSYVGFPLAAIILGFVLGTVFLTGKISSLYEAIMPEKKYSHYDSSSGKSVYVDDLDSFKAKSDILIGSKVDILKYRSEIKEMEKKYLKWPLYEIATVFVLSLIIILISVII